MKQPRALPLKPAPGNERHQHPSTLSHDIKLSNLAAGGLSSHIFTAHRILGTFLRIKKFCARGQATSLQRVPHGSHQRIQGQSIRIVIPRRERQRSRAAGRYAAICANVDELIETTARSAGRLRVTKKTKIDRGAVAERVRGLQKPQRLPTYSASQAGIVPHPPVLDPELATVA